MKRGRPRSIRRRKGTVKRTRGTYNPKQRAASCARALTRKRKGR